MAVDKHAQKRKEGEEAIAVSIEAMDGTDKALGKKLNQIIAKNAPSLMPKTWYGMPAYANEDGKVVCFFRPAQRFGDRFLTLGFNDIAHLDDGEMWPLSFAIKDVSPATETRVAELVKTAVK